MITRLIKIIFIKLLGGIKWKIILDELGVPLVDYGGEIGKQRNPVTISLKALEYYKEYERGNEGYRELFLNCADWLINNSVSKGNYSILEYNFPWKIYNLTPPWHSGMAQGLAIEVLIKAYDLTKEEKYLDFANRFLNSFFVEVEDGGVTYKTKNGYWYEEYACKGGKESRVLNGMMFALLGIHEYLKYTNDAKARFLFNKGVCALKANIKFYDRDGISSYDIFGTYSKEYHKIHIQLLDRLYKITNEEIFKYYRDKWRNYEKFPFILRLYMKLIRFYIKKLLKS